MTLFIKGHMPMLELKSIDFRLLPARPERAVTTRKAFGLKGLA